MFVESIMLAALFAIFCIMLLVAFILPTHFLVFQFFLLSLR